MVQITTNTTKLAVESPYNTAFVSFARSCGAKWNKPQWIFDARDELRIREKCVEIYGTDGDTTTNLTTVKCTFGPEGDYAECASYLVYGRPIVRAWGRDSGARLCDGVVLLTGKIGSGGSMKNWKTIITPQTALLLRDVPEALVKKIVDKPDGAYTAKITEE